mmetsp:Transcript_21021/g.51631  ORF Transcript_21021/g.51631 Transcript_21021/m.51631 type:complete len:204 (-) Transcript_21021:1404-2015(-)
MNSLKRAAQHLVARDQRTPPSRKDEIFLEAMHNQITKGAVDIILSDEQLQDALVHMIEFAHEDFVQHGPAGRQCDDSVEKAQTDRIWHCCLMALRLLTQCTFMLEKGFQFSVSMAGRHRHLIYPKNTAVLVVLNENQSRNEQLASEALGLLNSFERAEAEAGFRVSYQRMMLEVQQALAAEEQSILAQWVPGAVRSRCRVLSG